MKPKSASCLAHPIFFEFIAMTNTAGEISTPPSKRIMCLLDANKDLPVITDIYGKTAEHTSNLQQASL